KWLWLWKVENWEVMLRVESGKLHLFRCSKRSCPNTGRATRCGMARSRTCAGVHTLEIHAKPIRGRHRQRSISTTRLGRSRTFHSLLSLLRTSGEWVVHHPLLFWNVRNSLSVRHIDH